MKTTTFVTVIVVADGDDKGAASATNYVDKKETLDAVIEEVTNNALEGFQSEIGTLPEAHRIIVHIDEVPEIKSRVTVVRTALPEPDEDPAIKSEVIS